MFGHILVIFCGIVRKETKIKDFKVKNTLARRLHFSQKINCIKTIKIFFKLHNKTFQLFSIVQNSVKKL